MKKYKTMGLIFSLAVSIMLSACSAGALFDVPEKLQDTGDANASTVVNYPPLNYSKVEKELRFTAVPLITSNYNIHPADRLATLGGPNTNAPISEEALVNSFKAGGVNDMFARYQSLGADLRRRRVGLRNFIHLANDVIAQNVARGSINNEIVDKKITTVVGYRQQENVAVIQNVKQHMQALYFAYRYVLNYGKVIEPTLSQSAIRAELQRFNDQIAQLATPIVN